MDTLLKVAEEPPSLLTSEPLITNDNDKAADALKTRVGISFIKPKNKQARGPFFPVGDGTSAFRRRYFPDASTAEWNDWRWQLRNRIVSPRLLAEMLALSPEERGALFAWNATDASGVPNPTSPLPVAITPYYASLIDPDDPEDPIRRSVVPVAVFVAAGVAADVGTSL